MTEANLRDRFWRYEVLPGPRESHVIRLAGMPEAASFFFAWGLLDDLPQENHANEPFDSFDLGYLRRRAFRSGTATANWVRGAIAEDDGEVDDDSSLSVCGTSLFDRTKRESDPGRFIDPTVTPYLTLGTRKRFRATGLVLGDLATVLNPATGRYCHAIVGDAREVEGVEPSLDLITRLGMGPSDQAIYLLHPESGLGQGLIPSNGQIAARGERLFRSPQVEGGGDWGEILADYFGDLIDADTRWVECGSETGIHSRRA